MNRSLAKKLTNKPHLLGTYLGYDRLVDIHSEWIKYCWTAEEDVSLQAHRGSYKTTAVAIVGAIWWLLFHFNDRIILIRKDFTAASDILKVITRQMKTSAMHTLFYEIYGFDYEIIMDRADKFQWSLKDTQTKEGNINAFGMSPNITGTHGDKVLCDDIITLKDRLSQAERNTTDEFIRELRTNIIDPGQAIAFNGTPWHKLDGWRLLPEPKKYTISQTTLKAFTPEHIKHLREVTTPVLFAINYELKHIAGDNQLFINPFFGEWDYRESCFGHIDAKYEGTDTGALTFFSRTTDPDHSFQAIGFNFNCHVDDYMEKIQEYYNKYHCSVIYKEKNDDKGYVVKALIERGMKAISYHEVENKHIKITNYIYKIWKKIRWANETDLNYLEQITDYEEGAEPDDAPDSLASMIKYGKFVLPSFGKPSVISGKQSEHKQELMDIKKAERKKIRDIFKIERKKKKQVIKEQRERRNRTIRGEKIILPKGATIMEEDKNL
jgi:hypothetical protein